MQMQTPSMSNSTVVQGASGLLEERFLRNMRKRRDTGYTDIAGGPAQSWNCTRMATTTLFAPGANGTVYGLHFPSEREWKQFQILPPARSVRLACLTRFPSFEYTAP